MGNPVARLGDTSDHGGTIISASSDTFADGVAIARSGDMHSCPISGHGVTAMTSSSTTLVNGKSVIRVTVDQAGCGAKIVSGSPTVNAS
jgi:uncharacterized Zn-binding protein involved in type VI secretion